MSRAAELQAKAAIAAAYAQSIEHPALRVMWQVMAAHQWRLARAAADKEAQS